jgi:hypothetical protein
MQHNTLQAYQEVIRHCKQLFMDKHADYGSAWRVLRPTTLTDQITIKVRRIITIAQKKAQRIPESVEQELIGIINYSIMAVIQISLPAAEATAMEEQEVSSAYDKTVAAIIALLQKKNHDYDEAWRAMRISSIVDIILMKLLRIKHIEDQGGTRISEGIASGYQDIVNYAVFALLQLREAPTTDDKG